MRLCLSLFAAMVLLFTAPAGAADFKPSTTYLIQVNGYAAPKESTEAREVSSTTAEKVVAYVTKNLSSHPLAEKTLKELRALGTEKYALEFRTDASGTITTTVIVQTSGRREITADRPAATASTPAPARPAASTPSTPPATPPATPAAATGDFKPSTRYLLLLNGFDASSSTKEGKEILSSKTQNVIEYIEKKLKGDAQAEKMLVLVRKTGTSPYAIEFRTDSEGRIASAEIVGLGGAPVASSGTTPGLPEARPTPSPTETTAAALTDPEPTTEVPALPTVEAIGADLSSPESKGNGMKKLLRWAVSVPSDNLRCRIVDNRFKFENDAINGIFAKSALTPATTAADDLLRAALTDTVDGLRRNERLALFHRNQQAAADGCLTTLFRGMWADLLKRRRAHLAWDFKHWLTAAHEQRKILTFEGTTHSYRFTDETMATRLAFLQEVLMQLTSAELVAALPVEFRTWATTDTNTVDVETRKEPNDLLTYHISATHYAKLDTQADVDSVVRAGIVRSAIQHTLKPDAYLPVYTITKATEVTNRAKGEDTYFLFCSGGALTVKSDPELPKTGTSLVQYTTLGKAFLTGLRAKDASLDLSCGTLTARLTVPVEALKAKLESPAEGKFAVGTDKKVKGVATFPLVSEAGAGFVRAMKAGALIQGYRVVAESEVTDLKTDFFKELLDADFYFPAAHQTSGASFAIGYTRGTKLTVQRKEGGVTVEVLIFVPPSSSGGSTVEVSDANIAELFRKRRALETPRRLTVMNIACGSKSCVPHWMRAYKLSLDEKFTAEQVDRLKDEVPVVIGAGRSFGTGSTAELLSHAQYPFSALTYAAEEKRFSDLIGFLKGKEFGPASNLDERTYFDVEAQRTQLNIVLVTAKGYRLVH